MSKILCAVDFSPASDRAAGIALGLARALGLPLELLHVIELPAGLDETGAMAAAATVRKAAEAELAGRVARLAGRGVDVGGWVEAGRADEAIVATAEATKPALVVLGSHGRNLLVRLLVGSTTERCLRQVPAPILAVPPGGAGALDHLTIDRPLRVTAAVDFSAANDGTLAWLRWLVGRTRCEVTVLHLFYPPRESRRLGLPIGSADDLAHGEIVEVLTRELRARVGELGAETHYRVVPSWGDEENPLAREAEAAAADFLVLGTSLGGGASTAIGALRAGRVPVLCVPAALERAVRPEGWMARRKAVAFTDLSEAGNAAIRDAAWLLRGRGELTICHVLAPDADPATRPALEAELRSLAAAAERRFGLKTGWLLHQGAPLPEGMVQAIHRAGPDVVVVCAGSGREEGRPSRAEVAMRESAVPFVVVPRAATPR